METIETNSESSENLDNNRFEALTEMSGQFDPEKAKSQIEEEKQGINPAKHVKEVSPATRIITDEKGHFAIESSYLDVYYSYERSDNYDRHNPEDMKLGQAIWNIGFASTMLDCDKDFRKKLENDDVDLDTLNPDAAKQYKKVFNGLLEIANSTESDKAKALIEQMRNAGSIGEYFGDYFDTICYLKESGMELKPYEIPSSENVRFDVLEQEYANLMSGNGISTEAVDDLYAKYSELSKAISDPKVLEKVTQRKNSLFSLIDKLEEINKKINSID